MNLECSVSSYRVIGTTTGYHGYHTLENNIPEQSRMATIGESWGQSWDWHRYAKTWLVLCPGNCVPGVPGVPGVPDPLVVRSPTHRFFKGRLRFFGQMRHDLPEPSTVWKTLNCWKFRRKCPQTVRKCAQPARKAHS